MKSYRLWVSIAITLGLIAAFIIGNVIRNSGGENTEEGIEGDAPAAAQTLE